MDKRKLLKDIAKVKKQIFAMTSFSGFVLVLSSTIIGRGFDPFVIFEYSVFSLIGFGVLGFAWGMVYERVIEPSLIESYREDARQEIERLKSKASNRVAMELAVAELAPGMKVIAPVYSNEGALLVREGALLTDRLIQTLKENDIAKIKIEAQRQYQSESDNADMPESLL